MNSWQAHFLEQRKQKLGQYYFKSLGAGKKDISYVSSKKISPMCSVLPGDVRNVVEIQIEKFPAQSVYNIEWVNGEGNTCRAAPKFSY